MKLTLIDSDAARIGYEFLNYGDAEECRECKLLNACVGNLEKGRKYVITDVRGVEHNCEITGKVTVVEVEESDIKAVLNPGRAFIGSKIDFAPVSCDNIFCENMAHCRPEGLKEGDACKIVDSGEKIECDKNNDFILVKLRRNR